MTTMNKISVDVVVLWPERESGDEYEFEHAIVIKKCADSVCISQRDSDINVPNYALDALIKTLRDMKKAVESK